MNHSVHIVKVKEVKEHPNADKLEIVNVFGTDVVTGKGDFKEGEKILYFQSGLQLSEIFAKSNDLIKRKDADGNNIGGMFEENRKVKALNLRKIKSDGFCINMNSLVKCGIDAKLVDTLSVGKYYKIIGGVNICDKFIIHKSKPTGNDIKLRKKVVMFKEHFSTVQMRFATNKLVKGTYVTITEKLHGTSQRQGVVKVYTKPTWFQKLFNITPKDKWENIVGTRRTVLDINNRKNSMYHSKGLRVRTSEPFIDKLYKGEVVYYEVVGYDNKTPIMGRYDNSKLRDKEFVKTYGKETIFDYGEEVGEAGVYVYRITMVNEEGISVDYTDSAMRKRCDQIGVKAVPLLATMLIDDDFVERMSELADQKSTLGNHIMEGVCIRMDDNIQTTIIKHKSNNYKILEGLIKLDSITDNTEI